MNVNYFHAEPGFIFFFFNDLTETSTFGIFRGRNVRGRNVLGRNVRGRNVLHSLIPVLKHSVPSPSHNLSLQKLSQLHDECKSSLKRINIQMAFLGVWVAIRALDRNGHL